MILLFIRTISLGSTLWMRATSYKLTSAKGSIIAVVAVKIGMFCSHFTANSMLGGLVVGTWMILKAAWMILKAAWMLMLHTPNILGSNICSQPTPLWFMYHTLQKINTDLWSGFFSGCWLDPNLKAVSWTFSNCRPTCFASLVTCLVGGWKCIFAVMFV